jgi:outer membrane biosynthesis protein TonB
MSDEEINNQESQLDSFFSSEVPSVTPEPDVPVEAEPEKVETPEETTSETETVKKDSPPKKSAKKKATRKRTAKKKVAKKKVASKEETPEPTSSSDWKEQLREKFPTASNSQLNAAVDALRRGQTVGVHRSRGIRIFAAPYGKGGYQNAKRYGYDQLILGQ